MAYNIGTLAITVSLPGIAFVLHFPAAPYCFIGSPPTGFGTGTPGLFPLCSRGASRRLCGREEGVKADRPTALCRAFRALRQ